jgi:DNA (cytosine-5)-methyltransferase 1
MLRIGSLFSGGGGLDLGLERAGMRTVFQVESDPHARKVLEARWPAVPRFGDIRGARGATLPRCEVLAGGFPCQDIAAPGRGGGLAGARSGLWAEFARLVREVRPLYVLVENSPRLRSRGLGVVLGDLAACGYDAEWDCLPASAFGAPHERDRLYVVAYASGDGWREGRTRGLAGGAEGQAAARLPEAPRVFCRAPEPSSWWAHKPGVRGVVHGVPARVDEARLRILGNADVPQRAEHLGGLILEHARARGLI